MGPGDVGLEAVADRLVERLHQPGEHAGVEVDPAGLAAVHHGDDRRHQPARVGDDRPSGFDDRARTVPAEVLAQRAPDGGAVRLEGGRSPSSAAGNPPPRSSSQGFSPAARSDVKIRDDASIGASHADGSRCWDPTWNETPAASSPSPRRDGAPRPLRWWSSRTCATAASPSRCPDVTMRHEHGDAGGGLGDLAGLLGRVDHEQPDAEGGGLDDVGAQLDGVGVDEVGGPGAGVEAGPHLGRTRHVEAGARVGQRPQQHRVRVGLHRVVHGRARERRPQLTEPASVPSVRGARGRAWRPAPSRRRGLRAGSSSVMPGGARSTGEDTRCAHVTPAHAWVVGCASPPSMCLTPPSSRRSASTGPPRSTASSTSRSASAPITGRRRCGAGRSTS